MPVFIQSITKPQLRNYLSSSIKGTNMYAGVFNDTVGLQSYKVRPVSEASQVRCHFMQHDTLVNFLKSASVRIWLSSGINFASSAASLASSSAKQLPLISACPDVHLILTSNLDFSKSGINLFMSSAVYL